MNGKNKFQNLVQQQINERGCENVTCGGNIQGCCGFTVLERRIGDFYMSVSDWMLACLACRQ